MLQNSCGGLARDKEWGNTGGKEKMKKTNYVRGVGGGKTEKTKATKQGVSGGT